MSNYGNPEYWQRRYIQEEGQRFDWLQDYSTLETQLKKYMIKEEQTKILNIGCGNGQIQDKLYQSGYHSIVNNDISASLIKHMTQSNKYPQMVYEVMDVTDMTYKDQSFDMVLDKSTIDALLCSQSPFTMVAKMLRHIHRVLINGGYYFVVSYGNPSSRLFHLNRKHINFDIKIIQIQGRNSTPHYLYICQKKPMKYDEIYYKKLLQELQEQDINLMNEGLDPESYVEEGYSDIFNESQKEF